MSKKILSLLVFTLLVATMMPIGDSIENNNCSVMHRTSGYSSNGEWSEQMKLMASDSGVLSFFGHSVSLDGDYAILGAHGDDDNGMFSGAAYIFKRAGTSWSEEQKLLASDGEANDMFGWSVSMDEDYAIIGKPDADGPGAAYIFKNTETWTEEQKLTASDGEIWDEFGYAVSLDGDYAIVGAQFDDDIGSAYIFKRDGNMWTEEAKLTPSDGEQWDTFGMSVAIDGDYAIIGAWGHDDLTGAAYIFKRDGTTWTEETKLTASDGTHSDGLGASVSIEGDYAVVGALYANEIKGAVYIFEWDGTTWTEKQKLTASDGEIGDSFGGSVPIDGNCIIVGTPGDDEYTGSVYVFQQDGDTWTEVQKLTASDGTEYDGFGSFISIDGDYVLIGAYHEDDFTGSAYIFSKSESDLILEIKGGIGVNAVIKNNGTSDMFNVEWSITLDGGLIIGKEKNGTIDIPAGDEVIVKSFVFGLGKTTITVTATDVEEIANGLVLLFFVRVNPLFIF